MLESSFTFGSSGRAPLLLELGVVMEPEAEMALYVHAEICIDVGPLRTVSRRGQLSSVTASGQIRAATAAESI